MARSDQLTSCRPTQILLVDDHPLVREGLASCITSQPGMEICGEADSVQNALAQVQATNPDLIIVDILLGASHGIELIEEIHSRFPTIKMLVVSTYDESLYASRVLRAGANGYVNKREVADSIIDALHTVLAGGTYLSPQFSQQLLIQTFRGKSPTENDPIEQLSNRELQVFQLIGQGRTTGEIANQLYLSVHTIDTHREKLRHKLGLKNSVELMQRAVQWVLENGQ